MLPYSKLFLFAILSILMLNTACKKKVVTKEETITLKPANNPNEIHFFGNSIIDQTDKTAPEIGAAAWTYESNPIMIRAAFKFDLTSIPSGKEISSAKLSLFSNPNNLNGHSSGPNFGSNNAMSIQRITDNWDGNSTWNTQPGTTTQNQVTITHTNQSILDLIDIDVTNMVQDMINSNNYGFKLQLVTETAYNARIFCSSKYPDANKHPRLIVTYKK